MPTYGPATLSRLTDAVQKYRPMEPELLILPAKPDAWILKGKMSIIKVRAISKNWKSLPSMQPGGLVYALICPSTLSNTPDLLAKCLAQGSYCPPTGICWVSNPGQSAVKSSPSVFT